MLKNKKILITLMLLIAILFVPSLVNAATIQATETTTTSTGKTVNWSYELDSNNNILDLKCTNISSVSGELEIPSTIDGYTVVTIGNTKNGYDDGAFEECSGLTGITIPNTVTTIGYRAFYNCTGIKSLTLPDSITSIQGGAFANCIGLKNVTLSENLVSIGSNAFQGCSGFNTIVIPDSVTTIGSSAFQGCSGITSLTLSKNLTKISNETFEECSGLTSVIIPDSVTTIEGGYSWQGAFGECTNLEKILIPDTVATIGEDAFVDCDKLTIYGNDNQASKAFAEQYSINFKYISEWNESDVGDDITPPYVESILVPYSNVSGYYDSNSTTYIVPSKKVLIINVNFNESILATEVPSLTIKFGTGSNIVLTEGTVSGKTVAYTYTVASGDIGTMAIVSLNGGNVTDEAGNEAELSCPGLRVEYWNHYIYANGTAIDVEDENNTNNNTDNNTNNNTSNNNTNETNKKPTSTEKPKDTTIAKDNLPNTGRVLLSWIIGIVAVSAIVAHIRYKKLYM